jgi:hypothetical protein
VQAAYAPHKPVVEGQPNATTFDLILKLSLWNYIQESPKKILLKF